MTESLSTEELLQQPARQLAHDVKGQLAVVTMGLEALKMLRDDEAAFNEVFETIRRDGIEPLKGAISQLIKRVQNAESPPVASPGS